MFVYVEYESNLKTAVVEHTQVQAVDSEKGPFNPFDVDDFEPSETYRVHSCHEDDGDCECLTARIIHMTETLEEMVLFRAKRPRMSVPQGEADPQRPKEKGPRASRGPARRQDKDHSKRAQRQRLIEHTLRAYEMGAVPANIPKALESRLRAMEEQLNRAEPDGQDQSSQAAAVSGDNVPKSAYTVLKTKYEALQRDIEALQARNSDLEKSLKSKTSGGGNMSQTEDHAESDAQSEGQTSEAEGSAKSEDDHSEAEPELDETANTLQRESAGHVRREEPDEDAPEVGTAGRDGKLYAGGGYWFTKKDWGRMFSAATDGAFCSRAASLFWTEEELAERSVTGRLSNAAVARGFSVQRQPLSPEKLSAVKDLFRVYVGNDTLSARRMRKVHGHLSAYLCYMRRKTSSQS